MRQQKESASSSKNGATASDDDDEKYAVELVTVSAGEGGEVTPGSAVVIEVVVTVAEEIEGVACGIEIGRGELTSLASLVGGYPDEPFTLQPPRATLRCRIDRLPLAPGNYEVRVGVSRPHSGVTLATSGYLDAATSFTVAAKIDKRDNLLRDRHNLLHVESEWSVAHGDANTHAPGEAADSVPHVAEASRHRTE